MEAVRISETSVNFYENARRNIQKTAIFNVVFVLKCRPMNTYYGVEINVTGRATCALIGSEWSATRFNSSEYPPSSSVEAELTPWPDLTRL
jgi:hypothetical protein